MKRDLTVFFVETLGDGGIAHYVYNLTGALNKRHVKPILITTSTHELSNENVITLKLFYKLAFRIIGRYPKLNQETPLKTILRRSMKLFEFPVNVCELIYRAKLKEIKILHFQTIHLIELVAAAFLSLMGFKIVYTIHNVMPAHQKVNSLQRLLYKRMYKRCKRLIIHSEISKTEVVDLYAVDPNNISVIPHGNYKFFVPQVPIEKKPAKNQLGIDIHAKTILFFGAIRKNKGLENLIRAIPDIIEKKKDTILMIVGEAFGDYSTYRNEIKKLKIEKHIYEKLEYISNDEIKNYFYAADIVVLPYHEISQSGVLQIAYAFGRPVVATSIGGFIESIRDGENGYLVPDNHPEILAEKIVEIISDEQKIDTMGQRSIALAESNSWNTIAEKTELIYQGLR